MYGGLCREYMHAQSMQFTQNALPYHIFGGGRDIYVYCAFTACRVVEKNNET